MPNPPRQDSLKVVAAANLAVVVCADLRDDRTAALLGLNADRKSAEPSRLVIQR